MAEVKWIKIVTDIFDDEKVLLIENLPDADGIIVVWFKLLCLAGKQNNSGVFMLNEKIAYTDEMLSTIFRRPLSTVRLALNTFEQFGMIRIIENVITIPNWEKHQNIDKLEKMRIQSKKSSQKYREKQKRLTAGSAENITVTSRDIEVTQQSRVDKNRVDKNRVAVAVATTDNCDDNDGDEIDYDNQLKRFKGSVMLSENQISDLLDRLDLEAFNYYIDKLDSFIVEKGANVRNHYETILKWYAEDTAVKK